MFPQQQGQQAGGGGGGRDCISDIQQWWQTVPFLCKCVFIVSGAFYLIDSFITQGYLEFYLVNTPLLTIYGVQIWRIFTSFLMANGFLNLIFCLWMIYSDIIRIEKSIGSVHLFLELFLKSALIQVVFLVVIMIFSVFFGPKILVFPSQGLFPIIMLMITLRCLAQPELERPFLCFPVLVKQKYYHWILLLIFSILTGFIIPDLLAAILVGYLEVKYFQGQIFKFSPSRLASLENKICSRFKNRADFIPCTGAQGLAQMNQNQQFNYSNAPSRNQNQTNNVENAPQNFVPFQGRGVNLDVESQPPSHNQNGYQTIQQPTVVVSNNKNVNNLNQNQLADSSAIEQMRRAAIQRAEQLEREAQENQQKINNEKNQERKQTSSSSNYQKLNEETNNSSELL